AALAQRFQIAGWFAVGMINRIAPQVVQWRGIVLGFGVQAWAGIDSRHYVGPVAQGFIGPDSWRFSRLVGGGDGNSCQAKTEDYRSAHCPSIVRLRFYPICRGRVQPRAAST